MRSYCCFINPQKDYNEKSLDDIAPSGYKYGFPLFDPPKKIGEYNVLNPLNRGFYSATYVVQDMLIQKKVLKVIPKNVYKYFEKDFEKECILHARIALDTEHIVGINNKFDTNVAFSNNIELECHVAVLDYVEGPSLESILKSTNIVNASKIAQIAIDLFKLLNELQNKQINHNDLHAGNIIIKTLNDSNKRGDEVDNYIKVIAIDLGSLSDKSKSDPEAQRIGDLNQIASYLKSLSLRLLENPEQTNDNEYRLAMLLDDQARMISPKAENLTVIHFSDAISMIKETYRRTYFPWKDQLQLRSFSDSYNAQTLQPWYVPSLLVDPENKWVKKISNKGPLLITGMRGCGKTMLLRALQFHARAVPLSTSEDNNPKQIINRIKREGYVGLYVSCTKLLDKLGQPSEKPLFEPFSRLFISYSIEAIKTLRNLHDIDRENVVPNYYDILKSAISSLIKNNVVLDKVNSDSTLENSLINILSSLSKGEEKYIISVSPTIAFTNLAEAIKNCSLLWNNQYILYLLDDVSTRYFYEDNIANLLSSLIFQSECCAFKITSEAQTIEALSSPGNIERARPGRDLDIFDLGQEVYEKIRGEKNIQKGIAFIEQILLKRAKYYSGHPKNMKPSELLGNESLINIARNICSLSSNIKDKNRIYYGISALAGVCVGDIGEVIDLYEAILKNFEGSAPINFEKQSQCYRDRSSIRLFQLNRITSDINLQDYALSFAEASHELLLNSYKYTPKRLRQYYSIYIKITSGTIKQQERQFRKLIKLIDAGIFVFTGGSISPRTSKSDTNPIKQFVLIYRKIYGITNLIGLQQADRFELSGDQLIRWLENPNDGKEILKEGLGNVPLADEAKLANEKIIKTKQIKKPIIRKRAATLFDALEETEKIAIKNKEEKKESFVYPQITFVDNKSFSSIKFDILLLGLGFEDRAFLSIKEILNKNSNINKAICIEYKEKGYREKIINLLKLNNIDYQCLNYKKIDRNLRFPENSYVLCNISGLSKNAIYHAINKSIKSKSKLYISHTYAEIYFPTNEDIETYINKCSEMDIDYDYLQKITDDLVKGESAPYEIINLTDTISDELKRRVLFAFSSPKYERLFKIIDERDYDIIELIAPPIVHPRDKLAAVAADITSKRFNFVNITNFDSNNIQDLMSYLVNKCYEYYAEQNYNIEFALTGSKRQAVVSSLICSLYKVAKCWYVRPTKWDTEHFSKGVSTTNYFKCSIIKK